MFSVQNSIDHVISKDFNVEFVSNKGQVGLAKGERVKLLSLLDLDGVPYTAIKKKSGSLIMFDGGECLTKFAEKF